MIHSDFHIHSDLSFDGKDSMAEICEAAFDLGLKEICFTEHHDLHEGGGNLDIARYNAAIADARGRFAHMKVRSGVELGYDPGAHARMREDIAALSPDYVLLSIHAVDGVDPYKADIYYANRTREEGLRRYLETALEAAKAVDDYDAMAHIGYAARYAPRGQTPFPLAYADAPDLIDAVLDCLIRRDKALEVNTGQPMPIPRRDILLRYREKGGRHIVIGSDAHRAANLAGNFQAAAELLLELGFGTYCTFHNRTRTEHPIII